MSDTGHSRKITTILAADAAGYSRLMSEDEAATVAALNARRAIFREHIEGRGGRVVDTAGDSVLAELKSVVEAVEAAVAIQADIAAANGPEPEDRRMRFRIGVNLGDVIEQDDGTLYGDGVNIAARLEGLAEPGGVIISESAHLQVRRSADLSFADAGRHKVKNIPDPVRAFRVLTAGAVAPKRALPLRALALVAAVVVVAGYALWQFTHPTVEVTEAPADPILAMPSGPSIAVLPLETLGGDTDQVWFAEGLTEEIIAGLSKFRELLVYASDTSGQYAGQDARAIGEALGVRYVVKGSVQRGAGRVRVSVRLLDTSNGAQLWSETYDEALEAEALFAVQDAIREQIVGTLAGSYGVLSQVGLEEAQARGTDNLTAYDCVLSAYDYERVFTPQRHAEVRDCLERAVELDPDYADAWAKLAFVTTDEYAWGFNPRPDSMKRAMAAARKAVALDPTSQTTRWHMARTHYWNGDREAFFLETEKALALNPNNSFVLAAAGAYYADAGEFERGAALAHKAMAINPHYPTWYHFPTFQDLFARGLYEEALAEAYRINLPGYFWTHAAIAAAAGMAGDLAAAKAGVIALQETYPGFTLETARQERAKGLQRPAGDDSSDRFIEGLRRAGVLEAAPEAAPPVIAVLPFDNLSGDPEQDYFADGITEDIIVKLTQFQEFRIIAPTSSFAFRETTGNARQVGADLGADYVVRGSLRADAEIARVTVRLTDVADGSQVWAKSYDRKINVANLFAIQDSVATDIVTTLGDKYGVIVQTGIGQLDPLPTDEMDSYQCVLRVKYYVLNFSEPLYYRARECLDHVTESDPKYAEAWALRAEVYVDGATSWADPITTDLDQAVEFAKRAISLAPSNQYGHWALAYAYLTQGKTSQFVEEANRAIELNPNNVSVVGALGAHLAATGDWERGIALVRQAIEFNPNYAPWINYALITDSIRRGSYEEALSFAQNYVDRNPDYYWSRVHMIVVLTLMERIDEAATHVTELHALKSDFEAQAQAELETFYNDEVIVKTYLDGLRKAGLDIPDQSD
jgi:adenylate cyclase